MVCVEDDASSFIFHFLNKHFNIQKVIIEEQESKSKFIKRRAKRLGWLTTFSQLMFMAFIQPILRLSSRKRRSNIIADNQLISEPIPTSLVHKVSSVNTVAFRKQLKEEKPDLIVVNGTRIISKKTLQKSNCNWVNMHAGITPKYRGVHGGYWALSNNDAAHCGVTVHFIDEGIDTGGVLEQVVIDIDKDDNFVTYPLLQLAKGLPALKNAMNRILSGDKSQIKPLTTDSKLYYHPTICHYISKRLKGVK